MDAGGASGVGVGFGALGCRLQSGLIDSATLLIENRSEQLSTRGGDVVGASVVMASATFATPVQGILVVEMLSVVICGHVVSGDQ
ncbi:hypothetical protein L6452_08656 [Arctium lappa]|uniref:Uncharacterized protein n=1 Tax=Arctium lappa TaxID=4217 RepID=A0ACB9DIX3_ARCLA|nr:hypothetical protein L6452_08656 [Arctium lappa]